jgi:hypothetical protein
MADVIAAAGTATAKDLLLEHLALAGVDTLLARVKFLREDLATPTWVGLLLDLATMAP